MKYKDAQALVERNKHLIGVKIKGAKIDELVIHPTEQGAHDEFVRSYVNTRNAEKAIQPYMNQDVGVYAIVDKGRISAQGIFAHASLEEISKENEVNF
ncbi:MAG: hypothetical protein EOO51_00270 [Flavobacterium sp.]|nr:MAG: hypothetical protein EOO51_00270 [Flavobacterium sp.]